MPTLCLSGLLLRMRTERGLTKEEFDQLLTWLDPNPGSAGERYEFIRKRLITFFLNRQCDEAEDLADETINRVAKKVKYLRDNYVGEPARYFHGVAKNVILEHRRLHNRPAQQPPPQPSHEELEPYMECLDECLAKLPHQSRELILRYYQEWNQTKIASHKEMMEQMQLGAGAMRARTHRIRVRLEKCVLECLERAPGSNNIGPVII